MRAKMMGVFVNLPVVFDDHEQLQGCLAIFGLSCLGVSSIVFLRRLILCRG